MKKVFIPLWIVVGLFVLGFVALLVASFTTKVTEFSGASHITLRFFDSGQIQRAPKLSDESGAPLVYTASEGVKLTTKFETRETNIFDDIAGGAKPRDATYVFFDEKKRRHEVRVSYDRNGQVFRAEISFPDPMIDLVQIEKSSLDFKGVEGTKRHYESEISAVAIMGKPIIQND